MRRLRRPRSQLSQYTVDLFDDALLGGRRLFDGGLQCHEAGKDLKKRRPLLFLRPLVLRESSNGDFTQDKGSGQTNVGKTQG